MEKSKILQVLLNFIRMFYYFQSKFHNDKVNFTTFYCNLLSKIQEKFTNGIDLFKKINKKEINFQTKFYCTEINFTNFYYTPSSEIVKFESF